MENWQKLFLLAYATVGVFALIVSYRKCVIEKNNLGLVGLFVIFGAFVWADLVVFSLFWVSLSLFSLYLGDWTLFLLAQSLFWLIRSHGESVYWFNQQFSQINRNPVKQFFFSKFFNHDDYAVWFVMQIIMQCIAVVSAILSLYFARIWLGM